MSPFLHAFEQPEPVKLEEYDAALESGQQLEDTDSAVPWEHETEARLRKKLKNLAFLSHSVNLFGKEVRLSPGVMNPGIYDGRPTESIQLRS